MGKKLVAYPKIMVEKSMLSTEGALQSDKRTEQRHRILGFLPSGNSVSYAQTPFE